MANATKNYVLFNGGIDVDVIKLESNISLTFNEAIKIKDTYDKNTTLLFNTFNVNMYANYLPPANVNNISSISIYRQIPGQNYYNFICYLPSGRIDFYDFNVTNDGYYHYLAVVQTQAATGIQYEVYENKDLITGHPTFHRAYWKTWSITNIKKSETLENTYEQFGYVWNLNCNIKDENVTQNTAVSSWDTLGKFPKISRGRKNYNSSTFTGLLGNVVDYEKITLSSNNEETEEDIYKVQKLYRYTERFNYNLPKPLSQMNLSNINDYQEFIKVRYANEMEKLNAWKEFVNDGNLKLLKDLKGNSWIVQVLENPTYDIDNRGAMAPATISFNWQEVEDIGINSIINFDIEN